MKSVFGAAAESWSTIAAVKPSVCTGLVGVKGLVITIRVAARQITRPKAVHKYQGNPRQRGLPFSRLLFLRFVNLVMSATPPYQDGCPRC